MSHSKSERLDEFFRRLAAADPVASLASAWRLLGNTLDAVEDEMSGEPNDPEAWMTQQRMYPPREDNSRPVAGFPGVIRFRSRGHNTFIGANGAIEICDTGKRVLFSKDGADGKGVWQ